MKNVSYIFLVLAFVACDNNCVYEQNIDFAKEIWNKDSILQFSVEIDDSLAIYDMYLNCRVTGQYEYSNLYIFVTAQMPNNKVIRDTVETILAKPDGKWLGKGFGNVWSYKRPYKKHFTFPYTGTYSFKIEHAMRTDELKHVLDAGMRIEKN